jgi:hypothetical protein
LSNRKNQNSIIVLATLGVYLGLVLAGATPQVLAQAAMTRQFDIKDEIEFKDDLDNKPDQALIDELDDTAEQTKRLVSRCIDNFLVSFDTIATDPFVTSAFHTITDPFLDENRAFFPTERPDPSFYPLTNILSVTDLARGSLDLSAAS